MMNKITRRQHYRQLRHHLTQTQHQQLSQQVCQRLIHSSLLQNKKNIACYIAQDGEVDITTLIEWLWQQQKNCYLPIINGNSKILSFAYYDKASKMQTNHYGIAEPVTTKIISAKDCDAIIAPLVAFDKQGNRLGMGGGFYDCTLSSLTNKPLFIGVAFSLQQSETLDTEAHDIKLTHIVSENSILEFSTKRA